MPSIFQKLNCASTLSKKYKTVSSGISFIVFELICVLICKLYVTSLSEEVGGNVQVRQLLQIIYYHRGDYLKEQLIEKKLLFEKTFNIYTANAQISVQLQKSAPLQISAPSKAQNL